MNREDIYNEVIQEYSELGYGRNEETIQNLVTVLTDLVMEYGEIVYRIVDTDEYSDSEILDVEYMKTQIENVAN